MIQKFSLEVPVNFLSLGQMGAGVLAELQRRELYPNLFVIGNPDFSQFNAPANFKEWFDLCINKAQTKFSRDEPSIRLWHIQGSFSRIGNPSRIWTVHETSKITATEKNILQSYDAVGVPSHYGKKVFEESGIKTEVIPNFFDSRHILDIPVHRDGDVTYWGLFGKLEHRKNSLKIIDLWCKKYGKDKKHRLNISVFNHFLFQNVPPEQRLEAHKQHIQQSLGYALPWNVEMFGFMNYPDLSQLYQTCDIDLSGLSSSEGFGLPFHATRCLGKRGVALNAHAHLDYATAENSVLVEPAGMQDAKDGVFFGEGQFNQGNIYSLPADEIVIAAFEEALARPAPDKALAEALKEKFSVSSTVDKLLADF